MAKFGKGNFFIMFCTLGVLTGCLNLGAQKEKTVFNEDLSSVLGSIGNSSAIEPATIEPDAKVLDYLSFAVASSPEIAALREAEDAARNSVRVALAKSRPQVSANSTVGGYQADVSNGGISEAASVGLTASQVLFDGGLTAGSISEAELNLALAEVATELAVNRISAEAATAGLSLFLAVAELEAVKNFRTELKPYVAQVKLMAQSGLIDRSAMDEINGHLLEIDIAEEEAKTALSLAKIDSSKYFNDLKISLSDFKLPESLHASLSKNQPSVKIPAVREAALRVLLAEQQLEIANSAFFPKANLQAKSSSPMDPNEQTSAQAGIVLTYQIGDGGAREANLAGANAKLTQAKRSAQLSIENSDRSLSSLTGRRNGIENLLLLAVKKLPILNDQLTVAEKQIQTGKADITKILNIKLKINDLESRIRSGQAELNKINIQIAAILGLFVL